MTYTFKLSRRLAGIHRQLIAVCTALIFLSSCVPGVDADPVMTGGTGSISLTVHGLALQGSPQMLLTGPGGFERTVTQTGLLTGLPLGSYVVRYLPTLVDGHRWAPSLESETILIASAAEPVVLAVSYRLASGVLEVRMSGLPTSTSPVVRVTGPGGYDHEVTGTTSLRGLSPGTYTLTPRDGHSGSAVYRPSQTETKVAIAVGETPSIAELAYWRALGNLAVQVSGLPSGAAARFAVSGPGNFSGQYTGGATLTALDPGNYTLTPLAIPWQGNTWAPLAGVIPVTVDTGTTTVELAHSIATGTLELDVEGLPANISAPAVHVIGPGGFLEDLSASQQWVGVAPGAYTATANAVMSGSRKFVPDRKDHVIPVSPGTTPSRGKVKYSEELGALTMAISGLPAGVAGRVVAIGAGFADTLESTTTLTDLAPGTYTLVAMPVTAAGTVYQPTPTSQAAVVAPGDTAFKAVAYTMAAPTTGSLSVMVSGLPSGGAAAIAVTGPGGFNRTVTATTTLTDLVPGSYAVAAANTSSAGATYQPTPALQTTSIVAGATTTKSVTYAMASPTTGSLSVTVSGLPGTLPAAITLSGPGGYSASVAGTATLAALVPGSYTLTISTVTSEGGTEYAPTTTTETAIVAAGTTAHKTVTYVAVQPSTGSLAITLSGLPANTSADITVIGPNNYSSGVGGSTTLKGLVPGSYQITAANITGGGSIHKPTPASQTVTVSAATTVTRSVAYAPATPGTGTLAVTVSGLPAGASGAIAVTGPNGFSRTFAATTTLSDLVPGNYAIAAANVTSGGATYQPTPTSQTATVSSGTTTSKSVTYATAAPTTGALTITLSGLPGGAAGAIVVTGPNNFSRTVTATTTLTDLVPGSYAIGAANVTASGATYQPTPASQSATVTAGATTAKSVAYAVPTPTTGSLSVTVSGLPGGASSAVTVTGPGGYNGSVTSTTTLTGLAAGSYTITAAAITSGGQTYQPTPGSQSATVTAGATTSKSVAYAAVASGAQVTLNAGVHYQTIDMWETSLRMWEQDKINDRFDGSIESYSTAVANYLVDSVGINGVRLQLGSGQENPQNYWAPFYAGTMSYTEWSPSRYEKINDNNDPNVANLAGFQFESFDYQVEQMLLPIKARLAARGEQLHINLNYLDFKWNAARQGTLSHATNPAEFAEFVLVYFERLRDKYGIVPDAFEVILEPENTVSWNGGNIGRGLVAVAARLSANGFHPEYIAPSTTAMNAALPYFNALLGVPGAGNLVSTLAYHRYGGESETHAVSIRNAAAARGIKTAMLEKVGAGIDQLMEDLTVANVSGWQQWGMAQQYVATDAGAYYVMVNLGQSGSSATSMASRTKLLAHVFRSVRRGAVRIGSSSTASNHVTAAFINPNGRWSAIVRAKNSGGQVTINGLPAGNYEVRFTSDAGVTTATQTVSVSSSYTTTLSSAGILSLRGVP